MSPFDICLDSLAYFMRTLFVCSSFDLAVSSTGFMMRFISSMSFQWFDTCLIFCGRALFDHASDGFVHIVDVFRMLCPEYVSQFEMEFDLL